MANFSYCILPQSYTISASGNIHASYPAANILDLTRFRFCTKSINSGATYVTLDLTGAASDVTCSAFTFENVNFTSLKLEGATNAAPTTWNWNTSGQTVVPSGTDTDDNRRKIFVVPAAVFTRRFLKITPTSLDAGETQFRIGSVGVWPILKTLTKNFSVPYEKAIEDETEEGSRQVGVPAAIRVRMNLTARMSTSDTATNDQYRELVTVARNQVILLYENQGLTTKFYHVRRDASARISRLGDGLTTVSGLQFREVG